MPTANYRFKTLAEETTYKFFDAAVVPLEQEYEMGRNSGAVASIIKENEVIIQKGAIITGTFRGGGGLPAPTAPVLEVTAGSSTTAFADSDGGFNIASMALQRKSGSGAYATIKSGFTGEYTDTGLTPATAYTYRIAATNSTSTQYSNEVTVTTKSLQPFLTRIESATTDLLASLTVTGGYWYNWGTSTQRDIAKSTLIAGTAISYTDLIPIEDNLDGPNSAEVNAYHNRIKMKVTCAAKMSTASTNPKEAYKIECGKMLEDLKRVFGNNLTTDVYGIAFFNEILSTMYTKSTIIWDDDAGDVFTPGRMEVLFDVTYTQKRIEPNQSAV